MGCQERRAYTIIGCKENGIPPNNEVVLDDLRRVLKRAGLPVKTRFHDLRHFVATYLFALGEPIKLVSEQLGHSNGTTTLNVYAHVLPGGRRAAIEKMVSRLVGRPNRKQTANPRETGSPLGRQR